MLEHVRIIKLMYPGCLANSFKRSTKRLPEHVLFVVNVVEIMVSEYLCDKNKEIWLKCPMYAGNVELEM